MWTWDFHAEEDDGLKEIFRPQCVILSHILESLWRRCSWRSWRSPTVKPCLPSWAVMTGEKQSHRKERTNIAAGWYSGTEAVPGNLPLTTEKQKEWIKQFKEYGATQFAGEGRSAEITIDLVLVARAKITVGQVKKTQSWRKWSNIFLRRRSTAKELVKRRSMKSRNASKPPSWAEDRPIFWSIVQFAWGSWVLHQRKGSTATGQSSSSRWCRSGTQHAWNYSWKNK